MKTPNKNAFQGGTYSILISAVMLAILIVVNVLISALPVNYTKYDISSSKLYSITSNTKVVVNGLQDDVTIYWIVQSGKEDEPIENLLAKYDSLSDHITIEKKNPDIYPTFADKYMDTPDAQVANNSLVVECGEQSRFIGYDDIYLQESDMYSYSSNTSFDGEGVITSAIDYVVSDDLPKVYELEGHGELELPTTFADNIDKDNMEVESVSLLNEDQIPEDADTIMIYEPESDISEEEASLLSEYVQNGGKLMVMSGPVQDTTLTNLNSIVAEYGVTVGEGIVVEGDREHYALQTPHVLIPDMGESDITSPLVEENYLPLMPISQPLTVQNTGMGTVTPLLTTTDSAFSKIAGYDLESYEKEEGDVDGPFTVGVSIESATGGKIVWFSSSTFLDDECNAMSSGANVDMSMNALSSLIGEREAIAIRTKSLNYDYLTISDSTSSLLKVLMVGAFPLMYLFVGVCVIVSRKKYASKF